MEDLLGTLHDGNVLLGRLIRSDDLDLVEFGQDFPYIGARFEATPAFSPLRGLFDAVLLTDEIEDWAQEEQNWRKINSLHLVLKLNDADKKFRVRAPIEPDETISLFQNQENVALFINSKEKTAWFRLW